MFKRLFSFLAILLVAGGISFLVHDYLVQVFFQDVSRGQIVFGYTFNVGITLLFTSTIIIAANHLKDKLGFIFMVGSFIKLGIFLVLLKTSGLETDRNIFLHFFYHYLLCLGIEITFVVGILNRRNFSKDK